MIRSLCLAALLALLPSALWAADAEDAARIRAAVAAGDILPLPQLLKSAQALVPGEVLEVELEDDDDTLAYELNILTPDGRLVEVTLDARSGTVLEIEDD